MAKLQVDLPRETKAAAELDALLPAILDEACKDERIRERQSK